MAQRELCSDEDARWNLPCEDTEAPDGWEGRRALNGSEEVRVVRQLISDLLAHGPPPSAAISTFAPPDTLEEPPLSLGPNCHLQYATGTNFVRHYCEGAEKTAVQQREQDRLLYGPGVEAPGGRSVLNSP